MSFLIKMIKHIVALLILLCYTVVTGALGWFGAITYEAPAIRLDRSVRSMIKLSRDFPVPKPGWEECTSDSVPGTNDFVIKLCREGAPLKK